MKLRLRNNSVRIRLLKSEIAELKMSGMVSEAISFASDQELVYTVLIDNERETISSEFNSNNVFITIPRAIAERWLDSEEVGLEYNQVIDDDINLNILIEKDFVCLSRPLEGDNLDAFPNPEANAA